MIPIAYVSDPGPHQASMNARWLMEHGVPPHMILEENSSMETVGDLREVV